MIGIELVMLVEATLTPMTAKPAACIAEGEVAAGGMAWYYNGEDLQFDNKAYVKYGLPRTGIAEYVEVVGTKDGVPITAEKGVPEREVIYLLADKGDCSFQPYQVKLD